MSYISYNQLDKKLIIAYFFFGFGKERYF